MTRKKVYCFAVLPLVLLIGCASVSHVSKSQKSPYFDKVFSKLDLGGAVFLFLDIENDLTKGAAFLNKMKDSMAKSISNKSIQRLDAKKILLRLGLDGILAVGMSSYSEGKIFHNKAYIYHAQNKNGLLNPACCQSKPFMLYSAAVQADLAFESDLCLKTIFDVGAAILQDIDPNKTKDLLAKLDLPIPVLEIPIRKLIDKLDTRVFVLLRIDRQKTIKLPQANVALPFTEVLLGADNLALVFDSLHKMADKIPVIKASEDQRWQKIEANMNLPGDLAAYQPVLVKDKQNQRIYLASSGSFFDSFFAGKLMLQDNQDFQTAIKGLPRQGSSLTYLGPQFFPKLQKFLDAIGQIEPDSKENLAMLSSYISDLDMPMASVSTKEEEGVFIVSNMSTSHKTTLLELSYANPLIVGVLAAVGTALFLDENSEAETMLQEVK